jgi:hypothetical protein
VANEIQADMQLYQKGITPTDIKKIIWKKFGVTIKYWKAWHARGIALEILHGNYEDSYMKVPQ